MLVIVLVGMPGSGKEVFVEVARTMGFSVIRMGDIVREHAAESGLKMGDVSVGGHANSEREKHGRNIWARRTAERLPESDVIIDGSRSLFEIAYFKENLPNITVIGIDAPEETRFGRLKKRGRADDPQTMEDFQRREERESGWGIREAIESADIAIENNSGIESFADRCSEEIEKLRSS